MGQVRGTGCQVQGVEASFMVEGRDFLWRMDVFGAVPVEAVV